MKKLLSLTVCLIIILTLFTFSFTASAASADISLPENTPLFIKEQVKDGELTLTDEALFQLQLFDAVYEGLKELKSEIDISHLKLTDYYGALTYIREAVNYISNECPDMFWLSDYMTGGYSISSLGKLTFHFAEGFEAEVKPMLEEYYSLLNGIVEAVPQDASSVGKALFVYDYLALNFEYDTTYTIYDSYTFLKTKTGVCDSYSKTFRAIMEKLGIPTTRTLCDIANHSWNIIRINGNNYHLDVTHSDPIPDSYGYVSHDYFLLSTSLIMAIDSDGYRNLYQSSENMFLGTDFENPLCTDTSFDNGELPWHTSASQFAFYNGYFYFAVDESYLNGNYSPLAIIYKTKDFKTETEVLRTTSNRWALANGSYYPYYFAGISIIGSQLYYNTASSVLYYDLETGAGGTLFTLTDRYLCSLHYVGNGTFNFEAFDKKTEKFVNSSYTLTDKGKLYNSNTASYADDILSLRKYLLTDDSSNLCLAKAEVAGNDRIINVIDLIHIKKLAVNAA